MSMRVDFLGASVFTRSTPVRSVTVVYGQGMGQANPRRRITLSHAQAMCKIKASDNTKVSQVYGQVMLSFTPNFEWIEMFIPEVFPYDISFNSIGATRFQTDVTIVDSGHDQRISRWDQPLMEYDVAYGVRTMEHLHGLIAFFRAMQGRKNAFLYHDVMDHTSTLATRIEARRAPPISPTDQQLGIGDEVTTVFQLVKHYPTPGGGASSTRPIYKPKGGTVSVAINGEVVNHYTLDLNTGKITFTPRLTITDLPNMDITQKKDGDGNPVPNQWIITGEPGTFDGALVGEKFITTGWVNPVNNSTQADTLRITNIAADRSWIEFSAFDGYGAVETNVTGVSVITHPAPRVGDVITAGYEFYVPVRFDTDRLPVSLEEYGVGGAADVKLIEVRPHEENQ